jgi:hypothetical protein
MMTNVASLKFSSRYLNKHGRIIPVLPGQLMPPKPVGSVVLKIDNPLQTPSQPMEYAGMTAPPDLPGATIPAGTTLIFTGKIAQDAQKHGLNPEGLTSLLEAHTIQNRYLNGRLLSPEQLLH